MLLVVLVIEQPIHVGTALTAPDVKQPIHVATDFMKTCKQFIDPMQIHGSQRSSVGHLLE